MSLARKLVETATAKGVKIATAESCTGGLIAGALTDIPGSSAVLDRGFVTYSNAAKTEMLGVGNNLLQDHGAVSEQVARAMAEGALENSDADLTVAVTGIAGPGGSEHKPEGRVCFACAQTNQETKTSTIDFGPLGRDRVRKETVITALELLRSALS